MSSPVPTRSVSEGTDSCPRLRVGLRSTSTVFTLICLLLASARADDWPQWRGPNQDGISREKGLLAKWPEKGPMELWRVPLGDGFSSVAVVGDRAYTCFGSDADKTEYAVSLNAEDGKTIWKTPIGEHYKNGDYGDGPRATPNVDSGMVYVLGAKGADVPQRF